jgi:hypothetical protein
VVRLTGERTNDPRQQERVDRSEKLIQRVEEICIGLNRRPVEQVLDPTSEGRQPTVGCVCLINM